MLNKKGETLVEVIVSLVLFVLLMAAVVTMIQTSLAVIVKTNNSNKNLSLSVSNIEHKVDLIPKESISFIFKINDSKYGIVKEIIIPVNVKQGGVIEIYEK